jgi:hypothetical protein
LVLPRNGNSVVQGRGLSANYSGETEDRHLSLRSELVYSQGCRVECGLYNVCRVQTNMQRLPAPTHLVEGHYVVLGRNEGADGVPNEEWVCIVEEGTNITTQLHDGGTVVCEDTLSVKVDYSVQV